MTATRPRIVVAPDKFKGSLTATQGADAIGTWPTWRPGHGLRVDPRLGGDPLRGVVNHALVGHVAVQDWLLDDLGFGRRGPARQLAAIVGSHHGVPPESHQLTTVRERGDLAGPGPGSPRGRRFSVGPLSS